MSLSQMQVFNKYFMPATIETLAQLVDKFNAASGGAPPPIAIRRRDAAARA